MIDHATPNWLTSKENLMNRIKSTKAPILEIRHVSLDESSFGNLPENRQLTISNKKSGSYISKRQVPLCETELLEESTFHRYTILFYLNSTISDLDHNYIIFKEIHNNQYISDNFN